MAFTAIQFNANALYQGVTQVAHGFAVGDVLRFNGTIFVKAQADTELDAEMVGMVSGLQSPDQFFLTQEGFVSDLTTSPENPVTVNYVPGTLYYLSPAISGKLTATKPATVGFVELPCFVAYTATSGFFFASVGTLIESGSLFNWNTEIANTSMLVNNGYFINGAGSLDMTLPMVSSPGDVIKIATLGINGVTIKQNAGNSINLTDQTTTIGAGGELQLLATGGILSGTVELICMTANAAWKFFDGTGNWNFV